MESARNVVQRSHGLHPELLRRRRDLSSARWLEIARALFAQSVSRALVDHVEQRLAPGESAQVLAEQLPRADIRELTAGGDVRRDHDVRHAPQRVILRQRLGVGDVEARTSEMTRL